jgi:hypothetical protein
MDLSSNQLMPIKEALAIADTPLSLALVWASRGFAVGPADPTTKAPWMGKGWERQATTNPQTILGWKSKWDAGARVGIKTGLACGCGCQDGPDVLDFDVSEGKPGIQQLTALLDSGTINPEKSMLVVTPSGGRHLWFAGSAAHNKQNADEVWGVDLRAHHGWILAPGNPGYTIRGLVPDLLGPTPLWETIAAAPGVAQKTRPASTGTNQTAPPRTYAPPPAPGPPRGPGASKLVAPLRGFDDAVGEESPLDWYGRQYDLESMLLAAGWSYAYEHQDKRYFVRPGKDQKDGVSGNIATMPDGRQVFYSFSSSTELPTDRALSPGQLYAWMNHGGDLRAAANTIRSAMMPQRARPAAPVAPTTPLGGPPANQTPPARTDTPPAPASTGTGLLPIETTFWQERSYLSDIRWLARQRRVSPWAMLGSVLALASCRVGPHVVLPRIVGGLASLNMLVGLVGPSGKGKGAAWSVALEYLDCEGRFPVEEVGTPQGVDATFTESTPKLGAVQYNDVAFFYVPEIDTMKAHAEMTGSALIPHLRKMNSGERLGAQYAAKERRRPVAAHRYRASAVVGIQPARSGVLLQDADGGLPQRFLWLPVHDPNLLRRTDKLQPPLYAGQPPQIEYDVWLPEGPQRGEKDEPEPVEQKPRYEIPVSRQVENEIIDAREENLASEHGGMDSHSFLTQLKVAAMLGFLDRRLEVTDDDWRLARIVMRISDQTRSICQKALDEAERDDHARRGKNRAVARVHEQIAEVVIRDERTGRIYELGTKLLELMQANPGKEFSPRELQQAMDARSRKEYWEDVRASLAATPGVVEGPEIAAGGRRIRKMSYHG